MMKEFRKIIIMSVVLVLLIVALVIVLTKDINLGIFNNLAVSSISGKKVLVETLMQNELAEKVKHESAIDTLETTKNQYEAEKQAFDNIDQATIDLVKEATVDERYFIEYLWIVLGNYAEDNDLAINIITPGSTVDTSEQKEEEGEQSKENNSNNNYSNITQNNGSVKDGTIKIIVTGRYANVADFVYEVENDKELKFKLDNIKMTYTSDNKIQATFNVLSLKVKK